MNINVEFTKRPKLDFVCISDVINDFIPMNRVIYNPSLPHDRCIENIDDCAKKYFSLKLSQEQLESLSRLDCDNFIKTFNIYRNL